MRHFLGVTLFFGFTSFVSAHEGAFHNCQALTFMSDQMPVSARISPEARIIEHVQVYALDIESCEAIAKTVVQKSIKDPRDGKEYPVAFVRMKYRTDAGRLEEEIFYRTAQQ